MSSQPLLRAQVPSPIRSYRPREDEGTLAPSIQTCQECHLSADAPSQRDRGTAPAFNLVASTSSRTSQRPWSRRCFLLDGGVASTIGCSISSVLSMKRLNSSGAIGNGWVGEDLLGIFFGVLGGAILLVCCVRGSSVLVDCGPVHLKARDSFAPRILILPYTTPHTTAAEHRQAVSGMR